jgi:hypothetical protein
LQAAKAPVGRAPHYRELQTDMMDFTGKIELSDGLAEDRFKRDNNPHEKHSRSD